MFRARERLDPKHLIPHGVEYEQDDPIMTGRVKATETPTDMDMDMGMDGTEEDLTSGMAALGEIFLVNLLIQANHMV